MSLEKSINDYSLSRETPEPLFLELQEREREIEALVEQLESMEKQRNLMLQKWKDEKRTDPMIGYGFLSNQISKKEQQINELRSAMKPLIDKLSELSSRHQKERRALEFIDTSKKPKN